MPPVGQRPAPSFKPARPVIAAGARIEPAVSLPSARNALPSRTETAAPLEEPPATRVRSQGLRGVPQCGLVPSPLNANSTVLVLPVTTGSWRRSRATSGPSRSQGSAGSALGEPA